MPERNDGPSVDLTRREAIGRLALFGTVMAILQSLRIPVEVGQ